MTVKESSTEQPSSKRESQLPSITEVLLIVVILVGLIGGSVSIYGGDAQAGPIQVVLMLVGFIAAIIGLRNGFSWKQIEKGIIDTTAMSTNAILILFCVGALVGTWILAGTVPTMVYYGLTLLNPSVFYPATCIICALVSMSIGSSWTTMATAGVALIGVAAGMDMSINVTAGAIISGAYFGDKLSPLSDTTNLAAGVGGSDLFAHIRHMLWTSVPSFVLACILFTIIGLSHSSATEAKMVNGDVISGEVSSGLESALSTLNSQFNLGWYTLIPLVILLVLAIKKVPALPAIFIGALVGGLFALIFQTDVVIRSVGSEGGVLILFKGIVNAMFGGYTSNSGNEVVDNLLSKGGMWSMANTVWLILSAMMMAGVLNKVGILEQLVNLIVRAAKSTGALIASTLKSSLMMNVLAADQYLSIILPGQMWRDEYKKRGLAGVNLSRSLEDAGTITSPLIPWNTCGAYVIGTLGLSSLLFIPFCFFNIINFILAYIYGVFGIKVLYETEGESDSR